MWDWFILVLTIYTSVMVPFNMAYKSHSNDSIQSLTLLDNLVDLIFFVDIVLLVHSLILIDCTPVYYFRIRLEIEYEYITLLFYQCTSSCAGCCRR